MGGFVKLAVKTIEGETLTAIVSTGKMSLFVFSRPLRNKDSEAIKTLLDELRSCVQEESHGVLGPIDYGLIYFDLKQGKAISSQDYTRYDRVFMLGARWESQEYCILPDGTPDHLKESFLLNQMLEDGCFTSVICRASSLDPLSIEGLRSYPFGVEIDGNALEIKDTFSAIKDEAERYLDDLYGLGLDLGLEFIRVPTNDFDLAYKVESNFGLKLGAQDKRLFSKFADEQNED
ncbi:hypothetical protein AB4455_10030 [Vibrio sp. 10N.261.46.E12]|uniref:hypothetical protein n=1 Tax=unclassified Vibrio TaxID=2614977 RepID=UPI000977B0FA|nr:MULTISPECIES: hypothetical protein [unclassified Vibrio]OMO36197.1 hypothetical protein BH584_05315 [Vibrio sp. 10N.261.45.E1]PMJ34451.1 hypothetical protein BCU27_03220 [Vibrio sp. 10N.286.45.B6]PML87979.1 hypothetical protein BCT66_10290 [Vibrio sp. 10N.261.49.E11]PMM67306.1 hypothetical protein BCT48_14760 [Vibrio sp. 10N.261.46.F12]PMM81810.1 hypothetical protein BCT46_15495 [Vibrio sp. 10N.261.46.E8]